MNQLNDKALHAAKLRQRADSVTTPISRRSVLRGLSLGSLSVGLPAWSGLEAQAANPETAKHFFAIFSSCGTLPEDFFPADGARPTDSYMLKPLQAFDEKLLVLKGVHMDCVVGSDADKPGGPHMDGPAGMLTGDWLNPGPFNGAGGPAGHAKRISLDQQIANHIGTETKYKSIEHSASKRAGNPLSVISYRGNNQPNEPTVNPWEIYRRLFDDFKSDDSVRQNRQRQRVSVLDYLKNELKTLNNRLPSEDRPRLDEHLTHIRSIERSLEAVPITNSCSPPDASTPIAFDNRSVRDNNEYPIAVKLHMDLMFQSHACGLTKVSSFMFACANSFQSHPFLGIDEHHHELSHQPAGKDAINKLRKIEVWQNTQIAYLLGLLDSITEANGKTMLDNSLVLCGSEIGKGTSHTHKDIPWILAGSAGGEFRTGRYLKYNDQPHNNMLLRAVHAFGMREETSFGHPDYCTGPLDNLS